MRHAKAESYAAEDRARMLTERGRRDAVEAGQWLAAKEITPDHALISSATRTAETWECVEQAFPGAVEVEYDDALYSAGPATALDAIRGVPADARTVLVVGHNPTIAYLAHVLDDGSSDAEAFEDMSEGYPTAALAVLEVPVAWADLDEGTARIVAFRPPAAPAS